MGSAQPQDRLFPLIIAAMTLIALTLLCGIVHWVRPIHAGDPKGRQKSRFRRITSLMLLGTAYWVAMLFSSLALPPLLSAALQHPSAVTALIPGLIAIALTAVLMWFGQGGGRPSAAPQETDSPHRVGDRTEDRFQKIGVFYFNHDDPSVMVRERFGLGYTVKLALPAAWLTVLLPLLAVIGFTATLVVRHAVR